MENIVTREMGTNEHTNHPDCNIERANLYGAGPRTHHYAISLIFSLSLHPYKTPPGAYFAAPLSQRRKLRLAGFK